MKKQKQQKNPMQQIDLGAGGLNYVIETRLSPDGKLVKAAKVLCQTPLDRYLARNQITQTQFQAGQRIYKTWYAAGRQPRLCSNYNQRTSRGIIDNESQAKAEEGYKKALIACGPVFSGIVVAVCLLGESAGDWATSQNKRKDSGIEYLRDGLNILISHYKMA